MFDDPYPDVIDRRRTTYVHPTARVVWWLNLLYIFSVVGILYLLSTLGDRKLAGGYYVYGHVWLTKDRLILSPNWLNRWMYRVPDDQSLTLEIPRDTITKIEKSTFYIVVTTADREYKFTPLKAREYEALLRSQ